MEPHHILAVASGGTDEVGNLLAVCPTCHRKIHAGAIPQEAVVAAKSGQPVAPWQPGPSLAPSSAVFIQGPVTGSVVAGRDIVYKTARKKLPPRAPLADSLATDPIKFRYCKYLVGRYHEFKEWGVGKEQMQYAVIYAGIKREFGATLSDVPLHRFDELTDYLKRRILKTKTGRINNARGQALFDDFAEFFRRHG